MAKKPQREIRLPTATKASYKNLILDARANEKILTEYLGTVKERWKQGVSDPYPTSIRMLWGAADIQIAHSIRAYEYARALRNQMFRDEKDVVAVANSLVRLAEKMERRDKKTAKVLRAVELWMREYRPILDKVKSDQGIIGRVRKV